MAKTGKQGKTCTGSEKMATYTPQMGYPTTTAVASPQVLNIPLTSLSGTNTTEYVVGTRYHVEDIYDCLTDYNKAEKDLIKPYSGCSNPCKKESKMRYNDYDCNRETTVNAVDGDLSAQRDHLEERVTEVFDNKTVDLRKAFYMDTPTYPETAEEAIEKFTTGDYYLKPNDERDRWSSWYSNIVWRSPDKKPDRAGYDAAYAKLNDAFTKAVDDTTILPPVDALESLRAFEGTTFH